MFVLLRNKFNDFLQWSGRYVKADMLYLTRSSFWLILAQVVASLSSFFLAVAFANLVPKEVYGTYKYILSLAGVLVVFTLTGMNIAVTQAVARGYEGMLKKAFWEQIKWNSVLLVVGIIGSAYYFWSGDRVIAISFLLIGILSPLYNSANTYISFLNGKKDFKHAAKYNTMAVVATTIAVFVTMLATKNVLWLVAVYFIFLAGTNLFFYIYTFRKYRPNSLTDEKSISYGKHLSLINVVGIMANYFDSIFVFQYLGAVNLAIYSLAVAPINQMNNLSKIGATIIVPKFAERPIKDVSRVLYKRVFLFFIIGAIIAGVYILAAPLLFKMLFPKYLSSVIFSRLFAGCLALRMLLAPLLAASQAKLTALPKKWLYGVIAPQLALIISFVFLIKRYELYGAIASEYIYLFTIIIITAIQWKVIAKTDRQGGEI